ncbi:MAG: PKD domain-containing protein [Candidatus Bathyarchaeia archaeon]|nr:PKD domain-containing protein [Candidatus Bathyarchaeia archaeon]
MKRKLLTTTIVLLALLLSIPIAEKFSSASIIADADTPPSGTVIINSGDEFTNSRDAELTVSATDDSLVEEMRFRNEGSSWSSWEPFNSLKTWQLSNHDGEKTVYAQFRDDTGLTSDTTTDTIVLDTRNPRGTILINNGDSSTTNYQVTLTLTYTDARSGVSKVRYTNNEEWSSEPWGDPVSEKTWELEHESEGTKTVHYQVRDNAGNVFETSDSINLEIPNAPPIVSAVSGPISGYRGVTYTWSATASDPDGDSITYEWYVDDIYVSGDSSLDYIFGTSDAIGDHIIKVRVKDDRGAYSSYFTLTFTLNEEPNTSPTISPITGPTSGYQGDTVTFTATATDPDDDAVTIHWYIDGTWQASGDEFIYNFSTEPAGEYTITARAEDSKGAFSSNATHAFTLKMNTPPIITPIIGPASGNKGVTYTFITSSSDADGDEVTYEWKVDEIDQTATGPTLQYMFPTESNFGEHTIQVKAQDSRGANSTLQSHTFTLLDTTAPLTTHNYDDTWQTTNFAITLTATDKDGVEETYYKINNGETKTVSADGQPQITSEAADNTLEYWSVDSLGNEEAHKTLENIKLDKTKPTGSIQINNDATSTSSITVTLSLISQDDTSGISKIRLSNDGSWDNENWQDTALTEQWQLTSGQGTKTVYYQIMDKAGLESIIYSATITYTPTTAPTPTPTPEFTPTPTTSPGPTPAPTAATMPTPTTSASEPPSTGDLMELRDPQDLLFIILVVGILVIISSVAAYSYSKKQEENP